eukprot:4645352-Amphidinium_carterae.1
MYECVFLTDEHALHQSSALALGPGCAHAHTLSTCNQWSPFEYPSAQRVLMQLWPFSSRELTVHGDIVRQFALSEAALDSSDQPREFASRMSFGSGFVTSPSQSMFKIPAW